MSKKSKNLALALQGGGSHGAITWGVLDRLLEEEDIKLEGFSGTSAGAMNAAVLAWGLHVGGKEGARHLLNEFWRRVSAMGGFSPIQPSWLDLWLGQGNLDTSSGYLFSELISLYFSPYQFNPLELNPLRNILESLIDFHELNQCHETNIFICATNVRRGKARIFSQQEVTVDAVLASACLPQLFKAVTIDGEDYWDGGFMGNPPIFPLIDLGCKDVLLIQVNPINIKKTPTTSTEIRDRINELSFNSSLMLEMRRIEHIDRMLKAGVDLGPKFHPVYMHHINPEEEVQVLNMSSKFNTTWEFLTNLKEIGRGHAENWLKENKQQIGEASTVDIRSTFL